VITAWVFPFLAALSPAGGYVGEGRYMIFVWPLLALLLAGLLASRSRRLIGAAALLVVVSLISVAGLRHLPDAVSPYAPDVRVPADMAPLIRGLERLHVRHAFAHYWLAYRLDFESGERVRATPFYNVRNADYLSAARRDKRSAYTFVAGSADEPTFRKGLRRLGIPYERRRFGDFVVIVPARRTSPEKVSQAAGSGLVIP
jgi:hypothetical protein